MIIFQNDWSHISCRTGNTGKPCADKTNPQSSVLNPYKNTEFE